MLGGDDGTVLTCRSRIEERIRDEEDGSGPHCPRSHAGECKDSEGGPSFGGEGLTPTQNRHGDDATDDRDDQVVRGHRLHQRNLMTVLDSGDEREQAHHHSDSGNDAWWRACGPGTRSFGVDDWFINRCERPHATRAAPHVDRQRAACDDRKPIALEKGPDHWQYVGAAA